MHKKLCAWWLAALTGLIVTASANAASYEVIESINGKALPTGYSLVARTYLEMLGLPEKDDDELAKWILEMRAATEAVTREDVKFEELPKFKWSRIRVLANQWINENMRANDAPESELKPCYSREDFKDCLNKVRWHYQDQRLIKMSWGRRLDQSQAAHEGYEGLVKEGWTVATNLSFKTFMTAADLAAEAGYEKSPGVQAELTFLRDFYGYETWVLQYQKQHPVSETEIRAAYDKQAALLNGRHDYWLDLIVTSSRQDAELAVNAVNSDKLSFVQAHRAYSTDFWKSQAKDAVLLKPVGRWSRTDTDTTLYKHVEGLKAGELLPNPVDMGGGWAVVRVRKVEPTKIPSYLEAKDRLAENLKFQKTGRALGALAKKLKVVQ